MTSRILTLVICILTFTCLTAQDVTGDWEGDLNVQGTTLKVIFHIEKVGDTYSSTLDSPNQGAYDIKMDVTKYEGATLTIKNEQMKMETVATYDKDADMIKGTFNQGPMKLPLELERVKEETPAETSNHPIAGSWNSKLSVMGTQLRLIFHITEADGTFSAKMDSPDQGAFGINIEETTVDGNEITLKDKKTGITINGTYLPDSNLINTTFKQGPLNEKLVFTRDAVEKTELIRPQEPKTFDYKVEEVNFDNPDGGNKLAGTLTIPKSGVFDKAVVLVTGSGPQDRNEELLGHKPFLVLSDYLTKKGIAVLRYDDRGVGGSTGDFSAATSMDFASDATAAVNYLRSRAEMKDVKIGVMGHSEGGLIAPIVAEMTDLDFNVLLAGPGIESNELLLEQTEAIAMTDTTADAEKIAFSVASSKMIFDYMVANDELPIEELTEGMRGILKKQFAKLSDEDKAEIGDLDAEIESQIKTVTTPWFRYFISYSPKKYLEKLTIPVLAVNGSLDLQVLPSSNLQGIESALKVAGNENYDIKVFPELNHLFQVSKAGTGAPSEYGALTETFNEEAMAYITDWILKFDK